VQCIRLVLDAASYPLSASDHKLEVQRQTSPCVGVFDLPQTTATLNCFVVALRHKVTFKVTFEVKIRMKPMVIAWTFFLTLLAVLPHLLATNHGKSLE